MDRYTIYCTAEQTRKAMKLGAPIKEAKSRYNARTAYKSIEQGTETYEMYEKKGIAIIGNSISAKALNVPTAEEMIGWLEEQENIVSIDLMGVTKNLWLPEVNTITGIIVCKDCESHKESVLAAIDAALYYVANWKSE